jgi:hypothetical protein
MASLDLVRRHPFATAAGAGLLLGGIVGLFFPIRAAAPPKAGNETWTLPTIADTKRFREDAYTSLRTARFWKTVEAPGQRAPKMEWTLAAIITRPRPMAAVSQPGATKPSMLVAVGAELPDGSTLLRMSRDSVWFEKDGCVRERRLFRAVTAENNACLGEPKPGTTDGPAATSATEPPATASDPPKTGSIPARSTPSARPAPQAAGSTTP